MFALDNIYKMIACGLVFAAGMALLTVRGAKIGWLVVAAAAVYAWYEWLQHVF
ncbi:hypothetical protein JXA32_09785 [Candidatus Sumerlaeota bacterium]|nr:hypothetical protein [Candidatus Sumerlaeota bacterium]